METEAPMCLTTQKHVVDLNGPNVGRCRTCGQKITAGKVLAIAMKIEAKDGTGQMNMIDASPEALDMAKGVLRLGQPTSGGGRGPPR